MKSDVIRIFIIRSLADFALIHIKCSQVAERTEHKRGH
jgi:hypothetical protein